MNRFREIARFVEYDFEKNVIIEPESRIGILKKELLDIISLNNPRVIVKAGLGNHELLHEIALNSDSYITVVEPSFKNIMSYINKYKGSGKDDRIRFINGDIENFPIEMRIADLLISIDYFDFISTGRVIDEFRNSIEFGSLMFLSCFILDGGDIEGVLDDFMKIVSPLHNDYYLQNDLLTFCTLNELKPVKNHVAGLEVDFIELISYYREIFGKTGSEAEQFLNENAAVFSDLYKLSGSKGVIPYSIGVYKRKMPDSI